MKERRGIDPCGTRGPRNPWRPEVAGFRWMIENTREREERPFCSSSFFLSPYGRSSCLLSGGGGKLSPMGFLPAIPRRIVFFSVFCCGLLSASARSLSPRRRIVSPSLDTFVHRFDMFDAERANEKHRRSEIGRDFPSEAQHCCYESKSRFVSCMNR